MLTNPSPHVLSLLLLTLLALLLPAGAVNVLLTLGTPTINQYSVYYFQLIDTEAWSKTGTVQITFQSPPYSFTNNTNITSCVETVTSNNYGLGCYASSSSSISFQWTSALVTNVGNNAGGSLTMYFTLLNPSYVDTFSISYSYTLTGGSLHSSTTTTVKGLTADTLSYCNLAFSPSYTNTLSTVNIQITPKNAIPSGGSLFLSVQGYTVGNTLTSINTGSNSTALSSSAGIINSGQTYLISSFFSTSISSGTYLSFSTSSILTPPTTASSTYSISISTLYTASYLNPIDTKSCSVTVSDYPISVTITFTTTMYVGDALRPNITYTTPVSLVLSTDSFSFTVDSTSTSYLSVYTANSAGSGGFFNGATSSLFMSNATGGVSFPTQNMTDTFSANSSIVISGGMFIKSLVNSGNKTVFLQVFRSKSSYASGKATVTVKPNFLTSATILPLNTTVSTSTTYSFTIVTKNVLSTGGGLKITLPSDLFISTGTCTAVASSTYSAINSSVTCAASSSTVIFVTNIFTGTFPAGTSLTVNVSNILNPISIKPTGTYLFQTFYSSSELVNSVDDSSNLTGLTTTPTAGRITSGNFAITRNNTANMQYSLYTVTYTVTTKFKSGGSITLSFPSFMTLSSSNICTFTVKDSSTNVTTSSQSITPSSAISGSSNIITFSFATSITTTLPAGSTFTIVINSLRNYYSFKPITPQLATYSSDTYMIEQSTLGDVTLTNNVEDTTLTVSSTTTIRINGNPTNYTFSIKNPSDMIAGDVISATIQPTTSLNTQMYFSSSPTCVVGGTAASCSLESTNTSLLNITLATSLTASVSSTFSIANIILSRSFDQPGPISFRTFQTSGSKLYNISSTTLTPPINTATNVVKTVSLSIDTNGGTVTSQLNQLQKFTLTMTPTNFFQPGDIVVITVPSQYTYVPTTTVTVTNTSDLTTMAGSLCSDSTLFCSNNNSNGYYIRVVEKVSGNVFNNISSLSVTINNGSYQSPLYWTNYNSESFIVNTYSSTGQPIDAVQSGTTTNATFYLTCSNAANYCGTCYTNGTCKSCYALGSGYNTNFTYGGNYYLTSTGVCVSSCGGNFYNSSNTCVQCTAPCYGCTSPGTVCTSCINTTINGTGPFYYYNSTCATTCPNGYFQDSGNICSACSSPCVTCTGTNVYCTSCNSNKYLSTRLATCGDSIICNATYEFADATTSTLKCSNCSASCDGCSTTSTNCAACATGYIIDTAYGTTLPGRCTNVCPAGTVNDTANATGGGCRCNYTACATCETTVNTCLSCNGSKYLQNSACVSSCSTGYYLSNLTCQACTSNCSTCTSSACTVCGSNYYLYQNVCISSCPIYTTSTVSGGGNICYSCGTGCTTCFDTNNCQTCATGLYTQINSTNRVCVNTCSSGYYTYNTECRLSCPSGTTASGTNCVTGTDNSTSSAITTTLTTSSSSRFIPFPYTIALAVLTIATFISKLGLSHTILPAGLCAFGGIMQILAWITLMIAQGVDATSTVKTGLYVVLIAFLLNIMLNIFNFVFMRKYIWNDQKFQAQFKKLKDKTKSGVCVTYTCIVLSLIFSHKFIEILFSNLYESAFFVYKVSDKIKLSPFNYLRYISLFPSILAIIGGGISNYQLQTSTLNSVVFIQSIDLIIVTIFSALFAFLVTMRKPEEYQVNLAEKRNDIEEEFGHDPLGDGVYHLEEEEKQGNRQSKYQHRSSIMVADPKEDPLGKKNTNRVNPIGEELNFTNAALGGRQDDENRLNLQDLTGLSSGNGKKGKESEIDIDHINLVDQSGLDTMPPSKINGKNRKKLGKNVTGTQSQRYSKNLTNEDPEKEKIKENIENKLTSEQIEKTKIVRDVDKIDTSPLNGENKKKEEEGSENFIKEQTKNEQKKERLEMLSNTSPDNLSKISEKDRAKAGEMKNAMKILNAKKVQIGEYLQYLDIIQQQDEDKNSDDYDNNTKGQLNHSKSKKKPGFGKSSNKKVQKKDRTARKNKAEDLVINEFGKHMYDDDMEPQIPDFHQTPIKGRKLSENNFNPNDEEFSNNYSSLKKNQNRSDQQFSKKNGLNDLVLVSLESGENYEKSLGQEFQRGNTLKQTEKDELPPPNLYSTEKFNLDNRQGSIGNSIPLSRDRIIPNTLINDETQIDYLQSDGGDQQTIKGELLDFNNDISPAYFNQPNMRIENDDLSEAPTKPKLTKKAGEAKVGKVENIEDEQDIEGQDEFNNVYDGELPEAKMQRYQSNQGMLDYDDIIYQRKKEKRVKQLEKIYLPRQNVNRPDARKNRKNFSSQSYRKEQS